MPLSLLALAPPSCRAIPASTVIFCAGVLPGVGSIVGWSTRAGPAASMAPARACRSRRSEEHTSELQSLMRISYAVFCLIKTTTQRTTILFLVLHSKQQTNQNDI